MSSDLRALAARVRTRWRIAALVAMASACIAGFALRNQTIHGGEPLLDGRWWYSPDAAQATLAELSAEGRRLYAWSEVTLDVLFPATYGLLSLALLLAVFPGASDRLLVVAVVAPLADVAENTLIAYLAWSFDSTPSSVAWVAATSTATKWLATYALAAIVLFGLLRRFWNRLWSARASGDSEEDGYTPLVSTVLEKELEYIRVRRRNSLARGTDPRNTLIGLALSGGGIRSATTNLGILQALSRLGILPLVDYVCTVSGGGYIGACLTSLLSLEDQSGKRPGEPFFSTEWDSCPLNPAHREGRTQIDHLRTHGSFLVTRTGLLARETMRSLGLLISGTLYHLGVALLVLLVAALLYMSVVFSLSPDLHTTLSAATPNAYAVRDPAYDQSPPGRSERRTFRYPTLVEKLRHKASLTRSAAWEAGSTSYGRLALGGSLGFGVLLSVCAFAYLVFSYKQRGKAQPGESERDARERALLRRAGLWGLAATIALTFVAWRICRWYSGVLWLFMPAVGLFAARVTSFGLHLLLPRVNLWWNRSVRSLWGAFQAMTSYAFWIALLLAVFPLATYAVREDSPVVALSGIASLALGRLLTSRSDAQQVASRIPHALRKWLLALAIGAGILLILVAVTALLVPDATAQVREVVQSFAIAAAAGALAVTVLGWLVDANRISPHYFYQDRLGEAYLFTEQREQDGRLTTARNSMRLRLAELHGRTPHMNDRTRAGTSPYHLISTAINLAASRDLTRKDRKSGYFLFSKFFCGSVHTGFLATRRYQAGDTGLARAITISGAAASSGIGAGTFFAQAFATVVFNLRLGYWMPNPRSRTSRKKGDRWFFWPRWLAREMFMRTNELAPLVNLSDGGHTGDNVGIYPLLQRRCRVIIACDAERDPSLTFGSITEALRHAYIDLGIDTDIDFTMLRPNPVTGMSRSHCAVGLIRYPPLRRFGRQEDLPRMRDGQGDDGELVGYLIYLKSSLTGDEPEPVLNYKSGHPVFPHETTVDQFFDDAQFESYRALGVHIAEESLGRWASEPDFETLRGRYWPFR